MTKALVEHRERENVTIDVVDGRGHEQHGADAPAVPADQGTRGGGLCGLHVVCRDSE
jgi:hypothetical protein